MLYTYRGKKTADIQSLLYQILSSFFQVKYFGSMNKSL